MTQYIIFILVLQINYFFINPQKAKKQLLFLLSLMTALLKKGIFSTSMYINAF